MILIHKSDSGFRIVDSVTTRAYCRDMDTKMTRKIDDVLERVKEPESGLSIAQLGLVERLRYSEKEKKLSVFTCFIKPNHLYCCTVLQGLLISSVISALTAEFQKEFPDLSIEFV